MNASVVALCVVAAGLVVHGRRHTESQIAALLLLALALAASVALLG